MNDFEPGFFDRYIFLRAGVARLCGFTHYGWYYFLPIYLGDPDGTAPMVGGRIPLLDLLWFPIEVMEGLLMESRGDEPQFMFKVGAPIRADDL